MNTYQVEVEETLARVVPVAAETPEEAVRKVRAAYEAGTIVLDSEDYIDTRMDWLKDASI